MSNCRSTQRALPPYVDGELEASDTLHVDGHLDGCLSCSERVAFSRSMKNALRTERKHTVAPDSLRARIQRSAERTRASEQVRRPSWQSAIPWAAAAAIAIGIGGGTHAFGSHDSGKGGGDSVNAAAAHSVMLDEFAGYHARPLPPEELDPVRVNSIFSPIVGVPVHPKNFAAALMEGQPTSMSKFGGGRLMRVHSEPAATLFYDVDGQRVTVFVFDPQRIRIRSACCLSSQVVRSTHGENKTILVGRAKGYPLAAFERDGIGYAVSADMSEKDVIGIASNL